MILELDGIDGVRVRKDVSLAPYTTIGTGGRARFFVEVEKTASLAEVVSGIRRTGVSAGDTFVLGGGANLLVSDDGYDGVILKLMGEFTSVCVEETNARVGAAATIMKLISITEDVGLSGLEFLAGIPGTLGGAVAMNAGAWGKGIWDSIKQVNGVDEGGGVTAICPEGRGVGDGTPARRCGPRDRQLTGSNIRNADARLLLHPLGEVRHLCPQSVATTPPRVARDARYRSPGRPPARA